MIEGFMVVSCEYKEYHTNEGTVMRGTKEKYNWREIQGWQEDSMWRTAHSHKRKIPQAAVEISIEQKYNKNKPDGPYKDILALPETGRV